MKQQLEQREQALKLQWDWQQKRKSPALRRHMSVPLPASPYVCGQASLCQGFIWQLDAPLTMYKDDSCIFLHADGA